MDAIHSKWEVVLSVSGAGWTVGSQTFKERQISDILSSVRNKFQLVKSQNFTKNEADVFIKEHMIDSKKLDEDCIETNNNPHILRIFSNTCPMSTLAETNERYSSCLKTYDGHMRKLVKDLISVMQRKEFDRNLRRCLTWLENARHGVSVPKTQLKDYRMSYLDCENLTYVHVGESEHTFEIKLHIPDVYNYIVDELKDRYQKRDTDVFAIPSVRGYVFESEFLCSDKLTETQLTVVAVNADTSTPNEFYFPPLIPSNGQLSGPLKTKLKDRHVYYLRKRHPAIDGVVFIDGGHGDVFINGAAFEDKYLLLLQLSISPYKDHVSKGNDIRNTIPAMEGRDGSIAEYYQSLCGVADDRVIYVYVSPKETSPPSDIKFNLELNIPNTCNSMPLQFYYGFLKSDSPGAKLMKQIENSI